MCVIVNYWPCSQRERANDLKKYTNYLNSGGELQPRTLDSRFWFKKKNRKTF